MAANVSAVIVTIDLEQQTTATDLVLETVHRFVVDLGHSASTTQVGSFCSLIGVATLSN